MAKDLKVHFREYDEVPGDGGSFGFVLGNVTQFDMSGFEVTSTGTGHYLDVRGDGNSETVTGTTVRDVIDLRGCVSIQ